MPNFIKIVRAVFEIVLKIAVFRIYAIFLKPWLAQDPTRARKIGILKEYRHPVKKREG